MTHTEQVILAFGGIRPMAEKLGHNHQGNVQGWKRRNKIPYWRWHEIETAAKKNNITLPPETLPSLTGTAHDPKHDCGTESLHPRQI